MANIYEGHITDFSFVFFMIWNYFVMQNEITMMSSVRDVFSQQRYFENCEQWPESIKKKWFCSIDNTVDIVFSSINIDIINLL